MERYIYINYAYEDYEYVQKIIEDIEKTGVKVYHGNGSEERVAGSLCVLHFWTPAAHTSKSYRKIMNYTLKHELDTMLFHLDGAPQRWMFSWMCCMHCLSTSTRC